MVVSTTFIIEGNTPAKKNARRCFVKNGRIINIPSKQYEAWHESALRQLKNAKSLKPPYILTCVFYFKDNRPRDLDNALASVCDILQEAEIITNDKWQDLWSVKAVAGGISKDCPRVKVEIQSDFA